MSFDKIGVFGCTGSFGPLCDVDLNLEISFEKIVMFEVEWLFRVFGSIGCLVHVVMYIF